VHQFLDERKLVRSRNWTRFILQPITRGDVEHIYSFSHNGPLFWPSFEKGLIAPNGS